MSKPFKISGPVATGAPFRLLAEARKLAKVYGESADGSLGILQPSAADFHHNSKASNAIAS